MYGTRPYVPDFMIKHGVTYRMISDQAGSVRLVVNTETGAVVQRLDYDEFGRVTQNTNPGFQPFGFAGGLYDEDTKLVHFGAREYDAFTGQWTSQDPAAFVAGTNLHAYAGNDPVNFGDPSGLDPCDCSQNLLTRLNPDLQEGVNYTTGKGIKPYFAPDVADKLSSAIRQLNAWGIVPQINDAYRTAADQVQRAGNPTPNIPVADPKKGPSWHQLGYAVDLKVATQYGSTIDQTVFTWDAPTIVSVMSDAGFQWGGTFTDNQGNPKPDVVHFQIRPRYSDRKDAARTLENFFNNCLKGQ